MSEFGVRKGLLIQKALTKKMGDLVVPQMSPQSKGKGKWEEQEVTGHRRHLGVSRGPRKIMLVDVSPLTRFLQSLINTVIFIHTSLSP